MQVQSPNANTPMKKWSLYMRSVGSYGMGVMKLVIILDLRKWSDVSIIYCNNNFVESWQTCIIIGPGLLGFA